MRVYFSGNASGIFNCEYLLARRKPHVMVTYWDLHLSRKTSAHRKRLRAMLKGLRK